MAKIKRSKTLSYFLCSVFGLTIISVGMSAVAFSYSWFTNHNYINNDFEGKTAGAYYASGTGVSADDPFIITRPMHLYNLAWLQYMGTYNESSGETDATTGKEIAETTYFKLNADLDMSGWVLPPIGTKENPFVGNFNGNDHTVTNITISSEYSDYTRCPGTVTQSNYVTPNIIGFFGVIGRLDDTYTYIANSKTNSVYNLYLDKVIVKNGSNSTSVLAGLLAGYVNGTLETSGVYRGKFDFVSGTTKTDLSDNVSDYSLIGAYNASDYSWEDKPGDGDGNAYGTSTDVKGLYESLINSGNSVLVDGTTGVIPSNYVLPFRYSDSGLIKNENAHTLNISSSGDAKTFDDGYYTYKASTKGNNLGYYSGELKVYNKKDKFDYNVNDFGVQSRNGFMITNPNLKTPPDEIISYLTETQTAKDAKYRNGDYLIRLSSQLTSDNLRSASFSYIEDSRVENISGGLLIPQRLIWVSPRDSGTFKFVFVNESYESNKTPVGILFCELERTTTGDYSSSFKSNTLLSSGLEYYCKYGYFEKTVDAGKEYAIGFYKASNSAEAPYIAYMDIGTNASNPDEDGDPKQSIITSVDFTYALNDDISNGLAKVTDDGYTKSDILFSIATTATSQQQFYFMRLISDGVLHYVIGSGLTLTSVGTGANSDSSSSEWDTSN